MKIKSADELLLYGWMLPGYFVYRPESEQVIITFCKPGHPMDKNCFSFTGCSWGRNTGPGSIYLAGVMLALELCPCPEDHPVKRLEFRDEVIANLPDSRTWTLTSMDIIQACRVILKHQEIEMMNEVERRKINMLNRLCKPA